MKERWVKYNPPPGYTGPGWINMAFIRCFAVNGQGGTTLYHQGGYTLAVEPPEHFLPTPLDIA